MLHHAGVIFLAYFAMMNPLSNLPVFLSLTQGDTPVIRRRVARNALFLAFGIVTVFALVGKFIFEIFGISLPALRIAGGVVVSLIGYKMLQGTHSRVEHPSASDTEKSVEQEMSVAISPLGMPLLAGPGTIATTISFAAHDGYYDAVVTIVAFALLCVITYYIFRYGANLVAFLGQSAMNVVTRLMGLILAVIGAQMVIVGLKGAFPMLG